MAVKLGSQAIDEAIKKGVKTFRVNKRDGFVWYDIKRQEPDVDKDTATVGEAGFNEQKHKLVLMADEGASIKSGPMTAQDRKLAHRKAVAPTEDLLKG